MLRSHLFAALLALAGCAPQGREVEFRFSGRPSPGAFAADTREVVELCPACHAPVPRIASACANPREGRACGTLLRHPVRAVCGFCRGTKACASCAAFETSGLCRFCGGKGQRGAAPCFGCGGSGACTACAGFSACDACGATGEVVLPWSPPAARPALKPAGKSLAATRVETEEPLLWMEESILLPPLPDEGATWTVSVAVNGQRQSAERVVQKGRFAPRQPGSHVAVSGNQALFFDVIASDVRVKVVEEGGRPHHLDASVEFSPPLRANVTWERLDANGRATRLDGPRLGLAPGVHGLYRLRPVVGIAGLPPLRPRKEAVYLSSSLTIRPLPGGRVRSGPPVATVADSDPPLEEGTPYEWTRTDAAGRSEVIVSKETSAAIPFPAAGRYRLQVRAAGNVSPPVDLVACRVTIAGPDGRPLPEARLALLEKNAVPSEAWLAACAERFRVVVEDPTPDPPGSLSVAVLGADGGPLNPPVTYALSTSGIARQTRPLALLGDRVDDAVAVGGKADDEPEDPTLHARPRARIVVTYRGESGPVAGVGPMIVHEIPVRFVAVGTGFPPKEELEKIIDRRLAEAGAVWEPYGRRFSRASLRIESSPRNLVLVRGRCAGVDAHGRPSRAGARIDGREVAAPTPWSGEAGGTTPAAAARAFVSRIDPAYAVDVFEKLVPSDREAVVLRVRRRDGLPVVLEPLREGQDIAQGVTLLPGVASDGCEVTTDPTLLSLEELAVLLGLREGAPEGLDLFLVGTLRSDAVESSRYKIYPGGVFAAPLSGAALVAWEMVDGSGRYPYALARVLGELLLPPGWRPRAEDSLFMGELSPSAAADANKRVGPSTGAQIRERGRGLAAKNDDNINKDITNIRGHEQGGK
jgi:hypothetical protein